MSYPVQPGDYIMLAPKSPAATGNAPTRVKVLALDYRVRVEYADGNTSVFVFSHQSLIDAKEVAL